MAPMTQTQRDLGHWVQITLSTGEKLTYKTNWETADFEAGKIYEHRGPYEIRVGGQAIYISPRHVVSVQAVLK